MAAMEMATDRISNLPDSLIHQILDYLPSKEAARTSVLSKTWLQSYYTFPNLTFNEYYFSNSGIIKESRYSFFNFVNNTLLRFQTLNLSIQKVAITVKRADHAPTYLLLDKSLIIALEHGVKELYISVDESVSPFNLPPIIFDSPRVLTHLRLSKCKFPQNVVSTSKCHAIIFPFLKTLDLFCVDIDDGTLQNLFSNSPSLEIIIFAGVSGFKKFRVRGLGKLEIIDVDLSGNTIEIDIEDAPSLCFLYYFGSYECPCLLKVGSAPNLKRLDLGTLDIGDNFVEQLTRKSPVLEDLEIDICEGLERIDFECGSLKRLRFDGCKELVEVKIEAPSLLELFYNSRNMLALLPLMTSVKIHFVSR